MRLIELYITLAVGAIVLYLLLNNYQATESLFGSLSKLNYNAVTALQGKGEGGFVQ